MKKVLLASLLAVGLTGAALAADPVIYDPTPAPPAHSWHGTGTPFDWSGMYFGVQAGGGWGNYSDTFLPVFPGDPPTTGNMSGALAGAVLGYNQQVGNWLWGVETDLAWANIHGSVPSPNPVYTNDATVNWFGTTRLRLGVPTQNVLWFVAGGVAYGGVHRGDTGPGVPSSVSQQNTNVGWTLGAGADVALNSGWALRGEYLFVDLGSSTFPVPPGGGGFGTYSRDVNFHVLRAALTKKFP